LPVEKKTLSFDEAKKTGALGFFTEKYGDQVDVYTIASDDMVYSKEMCGGPHVENTEKIGRFTIVKQEKAGASIARVYATVE
jgi:alanyl-tRNA synthetase